MKPFGHFTEFCMQGNASLLLFKWWSHSKTPSKIVFTKTSGLVSTSLSCNYLVFGIEIIMYSNDDPGMTLNYFTPMSKATNAFKLKHLTMVHNFELLQPVTWKLVDNVN